ncbi:AMP deaminase [Entamoeba marina]
MEDPQDFLPSFIPNSVQLPTRPKSKSTASRKVKLSVGVPHGTPISLTSSSSNIPSLYALLQGGSENEKQETSECLSYFSKNPDALINIKRPIKWISAERIQASKKINEALSYREKYLSIPLDKYPNLKNIVDKKFYSSNTIPIYQNHFKRTSQFENDESVLIEQINGLTLITKDGTPIFSPIELEEYLKDYGQLLKIVDDGPTKSFASERLQEIHHKFELNRILCNSSNKGNKDFFSITKVDTHSCSCIKKHDDPRIVWEYFDSEGIKRQETLSELCTRNNIDIDKLTLHKLGVRAGLEFFQRFDIFNKSYKIGGGDDLRSVFLKTKNPMDGEFFAEIIKGVLKDAETSQTYLELRLSIYGRSKSEWEDLAHWTKKWNVYSTHNRWMIQFPRLYLIAKGENASFSFAQYINNIFEPLFEASKNPLKHPELAEFLESVSGFDSVDDESLIEQTIASSMPRANEWKQNTNPPYFYYMYYLYANISTLNVYRMSRGLNTFDLRPHCGECGHYCHLAAAFLTAQGINHGIKLRETSSLKYLYYLTQIGLAISPLSNHNLFCPYNENPFNNFFKRGLNVSLSSDDPLQFHRTQEPLIEEFSMAQQTWRLEDIDVAEICRNSVIQCGYHVEEKEEWIGKDYTNISTHKELYDNVANTRIAFRQMTLNTEKEILKAISSEQYRDLFFDIPATDIQLNYCFNEKEDDVVLRKLTYWLGVRERYFEQSIPQILSDDDEVDLPTTIRLFCSMKEGVFNVYNTPDSVCDVDGFRQSFVYCFDCRKKFCKNCFKATHTDMYHSIRHIQHFPFFKYIPFSQYIHDYSELVRFCSDGPSRSFCFKQLHCREELFKLHRILNNSLEKQEIKKLPNDFDKTVKVDTVVSASRCFHPRDLLNLIVDKVMNEGDNVVFPELTVTTTNGTRVFKHVTLKNAFNIYGINEFSLDNLSVTFDPSLIQRYDLWDSRNTIFNVKELRDLFLTTNNSVNGRYLCEFLHETRYKQFTENKTQKTELHFCLNGRSMNELGEIAKVIIENKLIETECNNFCIQLPRKYAQMKKEGHVSNFEQLLRHMFEPFFKATLNPEQYPEIDQFLSNVGSIDCKGDENDNEGKISLQNLPPPNKWNSFKEPPFAYWIYYVYANVMVLNNLRKQLNRNIFDFKPHCGETGDPMHNAAAFLTAHSISHGTTLDGQNPLQYLYILAQIGISCCPIYGKLLYDVLEHPFYKFFMRGMLVTLATDSPMHTHTTKEPLVEEYASATKIFKLTSVDLAEISRNSVTISSFPLELKNKFFADVDGESSCVPRARLEFRKKVGKNDLQTFLKYTGGNNNLACVDSMHSSMNDLD